MGTATVTIADLSRPRVGVAIDVPGHAIGAPGWADMALANGRFETGRAGEDYLAGNFHGRPRLRVGLGRVRYRHLGWRVRGKAATLVLVEPCETTQLSSVEFDWKRCQGF